MFPTLKVHIAGQGAQIIEEGFANPEFGAQQFIFGIQQVQNGVEEKGQQIEGQQEGRQMLVSMPKVVFEVVAFGFEDIVVLILHFPAGSSSLHNFFDIRPGNLMPSSPGIPKGGFAGGLVLDGHFAPIHLQGVCSCS